LTQETPADAEAAARSIQFDLSLAYAKMLSRISPQGLRLLQWVFFATGSPLKFEELRFAIAVKEGMKDLDTKRQLPFPSFIDLALGLLVVDHNGLWGDTVRFAHLTIKDYLSEHASQYFPDGHAPLARTCLTYLNFTALSSDSGRARFLRSGDLFIFFWHVAFNWGHYVRQAEDDIKTCDIAVEWLLSERFQQLEYLRHQNSMLSHDIMNERTPLHESCYFGLVSVTAKLLESGQNVFAVDSHKMVPLHYAAQHNHLAVVQVLFQFAYKAGVDVQGEPVGNVPLHDASQAGYTATTPHTLTQHLDSQINFQDDSGRTALHYAAERQRPDIVHLLLEHPALNVNLADKNGWTALTGAVDHGRIETIQLLLAHRDIHISASRVGERGFWESRRYPNLHGHITSLPGDLRLQLGIKTSLYLAASEGDTETVKAFLQEPNPELNVQCREDRATALHQAAELGYLGVVQALLLHPEIKVNVADRDGWTPLIYASFRDHGDIVKALLQHREIDVNCADRSDRQTALIYAAEAGYRGIVKMLLQHPDTDVNRVHKLGWTALAAAADGGYTEIVQMLLAHKDIDIQASRVNVPGFWELKRNILTGNDKTLPDDLIAQLGIHPGLFTDLEIGMFCGNSEALTSGVAMAGAEGESIIRT
jgi:ankyrin repeat protein